jgi:hypothetical protein
MMGVQYANLTMATAVSGRLTHTIPWDVLSLRRAGEEICRHDLPITVGRKPRRFWVGPPFRYASPCAGFEPFVTR